MSVTIKPEDNNSPEAQYFDEGLPPVTQEKASLPVLVIWGFFQRANLLRLRNITSERGRADE